MIKKKIKKASDFFVKLAFFNLIHSYLFKIENPILLQFAFWANTI